MTAYMGLFPILTEPVALSSLLDYLVEARSSQREFRDSQLELRCRENQLKINVLVNGERYIANPHFADQDSSGFSRQYFRALKEEISARTADGKVLTHQYKGQISSSQFTILDMSEDRLIIQQGRPSKTHPVQPVASTYL